MLQHARRSTDLQITDAEWAHHIAMMARSEEIRRKLRSPAPRAEVRPAAPKPANVITVSQEWLDDIRKPDVRHPLDCVLYRFPIGPAFVPKDAPPEFNPNKPRIRPRDIIAECARLGGISPDDICSSARTLNCVRPRQLAMWRVHRECAPRSMPQIGRDFGGRDHTTVLNALRKVDQAIRLGVLDPNNPQDWFAAGYNVGRIA